MSAEGPVRKPSSEPPDVDSLMSRLDGQGDGEPERSSDPSGERRPSAAELLGGRGRRTKRTIRVPDDAVPAGTPPPAPVRRSVPPPAAAAPAPAPALAPMPTTGAASTPASTGPASAPPVTTAATPAAKASPLPAAPAPDLLPKDSFIPEAARITPQRIISVGATHSYPPPPQPSVPQPSVPQPSQPVASQPSVAEASALPSPVSSQPAVTPFSIVEPPPTPAAGLPPSDVRLAAAAPARPESVPEASGVQPLPDRPVSDAPVLPNLDAQVREALALLDREDFETTIEISVADEEPTNPALPKVELPGAARARAVGSEDEAPSSEDLGDDELEEVRDENAAPVTKPHVPPPRRGPPSGRPTAPTDGAGAVPIVIAPVPVPVMPPTGPVVSSTLPSAAATAAPAPAPEPPTQPRIVVAAAASAAAGPAVSPVSGPGSAPAAPPPAAPVAPAPAPADASGELRKKKRQWFEELFNDDYCRTLPKLDARFLEREVGFIDDALGCDKGATILDLGCGPGEHSVALAGRGYEVIGIDLSLAMLARAADEAAEKSMRINFLQGDMRDLTFEEAFDGIYCWGTTFGYFDDAKNAEVIQKIHRALRRGGRFLLDVANRDYVACRTPSMVWFEGDGCVCMDEVHLNAITSRLQVKRTMMMEDGRQREIDYSIRLYALHELGKLLHDAGFRVAEASGDTSTPGVYFGSESPRILILAEKR